MHVVSRARRSEGGGGPPPPSERHGLLNIIIERYIMITYYTWNVEPTSIHEYGYIATIIILERYNYHDNPNKLKNVDRSHYLSNKFLSFLPY